MSRGIAGSPRNLLHDHRVRALDVDDAAAEHQADADPAAGLERRQLERRIGFGRDHRPLRVSRQRRDPENREHTENRENPEHLANEAIFHGGIIPVWVIRGAEASVTIGACLLTFSPVFRMPSRTPSAPRPRPLSRCRAADVLPAGSCMPTTSC